MKGPIKGVLKEELENSLRMRRQYESALKKLPKKEIEKYEEAKKLRAKYRNLLSQVKKQIKFLKGTLRGKEAI